MLAVSERTVIDIDLPKKSTQVLKAQSTKNQWILQQGLCNQFSPLQFQMIQTLHLESNAKCSATQFLFVHMVKLFSENMSMRPSSSFLLCLPQVLPAFTPIPLYSLLLYLLNALITVKGEPFKSIIIEPTKQLFLGLHASRTR